MSDQNNEHDADSVHSSEQAAAGGEAGGVTPVYLDATEASERPDDGPAENATADRRGRRRGRSVVGGILVVLLGLMTALAIVTVWLHRTLLDTDNFTDVVTGVISDPELTDPLGEYLTEQVLDAIELEERVDQALGGLDLLIEEQILGLLDLNPNLEARLAAIPRPRFTDLTEPLVTGVEDAVSTRVQEYLQSERFQTRLPELAARAHSFAVALLRGDYEELPKVVVDAQSVSLDLTPLVADVIQRLVEGGLGIIGLEPPSAFTAEADTPEAARAWLEDTLNRELDPDFAQITIMSTDRLEALQTVVRFFDRLVWLLVALSVLLLVAALWVAARKSRAVVQAALSVAAASLIGWLVIRRLEQAVIDAFGDPAGREAARVLLENTILNLAWIAGVIALISLAVGTAAFVVSRGWHRSVARWASGLRRAEPGTTPVERFVASHYDGMRIAGAAAAGIVLFITGLGLVPVIVIGLILAAYLAVLAWIARRAFSGETADLQAAESG